MINIVIFSIILILIIVFIEWNINKIDNQIDTFENNGTDETPATYPFGKQYKNGPVNVEFPNAENILNINTCNSLINNDYSNIKRDSMGVYITNVVNANGDTNKEAFLFRRPRLLLNNKDNYDIEVIENNPFSMPNQIGLILLENDKNNININPVETF